MAEHTDRAQVGRAIAAADLDHADRQYTAVGQQVHTGDSSQELRRAARGRLARSALGYAKVYGWQPPQEAVPAP
jgi:hypothetical protein